jgi:hypothetical protein
MANFIQSQLLYIQKYIINAEARMFKRTIFIAMCLGILLYVDGFAAELTLELNFAKPATEKIIAPKPIAKAQEVSGNVIIDITPYPSVVEKDRYLVEYFLDDQLIFRTTGFDENSPDKLSFKYLFDTDKYQNGEYKLIVNFWDESGPSAIGIKVIAINNEQQ